MLQSRRRLSVESVAPIGLRVGAGPIGISARIECVPPFVSFPAYAVWRTLALWLAHAGLGNSPRTIQEELRQVRSADVVRCVIKPSDGRGCGGGVGGGDEHCSLVS